MSLQVDDSGRRGRSRSPSRREHSSSRVEVSSSGRDRDRDRDRNRNRDDDKRASQDTPNVVEAPYPGDNIPDGGAADPRYTPRILDYDGDDTRSGHPRHKSVDIQYGDGKREKDYSYEKEGRPRERDRERERERDRDHDRDRNRITGTPPSPQSKVEASAADVDKFAFLPAKYAKGSDKAKKLYRKDRDSGSGDQERERDRQREYYDREYGRVKVAQATERSRPEHPGRPERPDPRQGRGETRNHSDDSLSDDDEEDDSDDDEDLAYGTIAIPSLSLQDNMAYGAMAAPASPSSRKSKYHSSQPRQPEYKMYSYGESKGRDSDQDRRDNQSPQYARHPQYPRDRRDSRRGRDDSEDERRNRAAKATASRHQRSYSDDPRRSSAQVYTVGPPHRSGGSRARSRSPPPGKETARLSLNTLTVNQPHHSHTSIALAPASPLLESYHGTYQSISPMPSPLLLASHGPRGPSSSDVRILDINGPESDEDAAGGGSGGAGGDRIRRRARFYDPETDAERLAKALRGDRHRPDIGPLIEILPGLTHEQVMELRSEYKRIVKAGPERRGINVAKHIRARLKDEDPALMKVCYATALGRWESEAYWANFWYHGDKTRRELLIESLMGRSNDEIRHIKDSFSDKKYGDSLTKCMATELKEDKFKRAVLFVLSEKRMEEFDRDGRLLPIDGALVEEDTVALHRAIRSERGGETAMVNVVVQRSDSHLREVLRLYSSRYQTNFARDSLKKSGNLVGEMLAHILNGVVNKPVRDALLVHHALTASKRDGLRRELLISRLVRFHWDRHHMAAVKAAYRSRYDRDMQDAIRDTTGNSDWGLFCRELCITRHPDEVKQVERIEIHHGDRR